MTENDWPNNPCPPGPVGGTTVGMKLDEIIGLAAGSPDPMAQPSADKALELKTIQPPDPLRGSGLVANAADNAAGGQWTQCKAELEQVE